MKKNLWRGLTSVSAFMLVIATLGSQTAMAYDGAINTFLGVKTVEIINTGDAGEDTAYFKSAYGDFTEENLKHLVEDSFEQTIAEMVEGAALLKNENNALPLDKSSERISFFGHASVDPIYKGNSAGVDPMPGYRINFPQAFRMDGFTLNEELVDALSASPVTRAKNNYFWMDCTNATQGIADGEDPIDFYTPELRSTWESETGGTAIMVLTRCGQENYDMRTDNLAGFVKGEGMFDPPPEPRHPHRPELPGSSSRGEGHPGHAEGRQGGRILLQDHRSPKHRQHHGGRLAGGVRRGCLRLYRPAGRRRCPRGRKAPGRGGKLLRAHR